EGRRRVKNQLAKMDETFAEIEFKYTDQKNNTFEIIPLEEKQYPSLVNKIKTEGDKTDSEQNSQGKEPDTDNVELESGKHIVIDENTKGQSYEKLFAAYLKGAKQVHLYDPYIRKFHQAKNLMEFLQLLLKIQEEGEDIEVTVVTKHDDFRKEETEEKLELLKDSFDGMGIEFNYEFDQSPSFHARSIETDTGWKILLDRGLDIFQPYDFKNPFNLANNIQEERICKSFQVTYLKE
ncbi:MAG: MIT C-terminal domain-containing protein, partial [bacterium]